MSTTTPLGHREIRDGAEQIVFTRTFSAPRRLRAGGPDVLARGGFGRTSPDRRHGHRTWLGTAPP